ncbi:PIN domain nuclease [Mesorhizobium sp. CAU 1732]|uniref:type II toxin-antitoxin system VapC family toxin n=1 Tax=Mesorhizobium sp. CAU 1732 TaxID=3140358 RepID=UPI0032616B2C
MIVVDSSVWIASFRGIYTPSVKHLHGIRNTGQILVGDVILLELLQGARSDNDARKIQRVMSDFTTANMMDVHIAVQAAANYRRLRELGITVRKSIDVIIATFCIENDHVLLHQDRDFHPFASHLGLRTVG